MGRGRTFGGSHVQKPERIPAHGRRVYGILGRLPKPKYIIAVDGAWIGSWHSIPGHEYAGRVFAVREWNSKDAAIQHARKIRSGRTVEVFEDYGSFPQDRVVIWKRG